jgi:hypothetical protein
VRPAVDRAIEARRKLMAGEISAKEAKAINSEANTALKEARKELTTLRQLHGKINALIREKKKERK